jgi:hypothetical protein
MSFQVLAKEDNGTGRAGMLPIISAPGESSFAVVMVTMMQSTMRSMMRMMT